MEIEQPWAELARRDLIVAVLSHARGPRTQRRGRVQRHVPAHPRALKSSTKEPKVLRMKRQRFRRHKRHTHIHVLPACNQKLQVFKEMEHLRETRRLEPLIRGRSVDQVVRVLTLVVRRRSRSRHLSPHHIHLPPKIFSDLIVTFALLPSPSSAVRTASLPTKLPKY